VPYSDEPLVAEELVQNRQQLIMHLSLAAETSSSNPQDCSERIAAIRKLTALLDKEDVPMEIPIIIGATFDSYVYFRELN
jgi:hypothetical protein